MNDPSDPSLARDLRDNVVGEFPLKRLWRDRRRILLDPAVAVRPASGLSTSPLRFAIALTVAPLLLVCWLMAQLAATIEPAPPLPAKQRAAAAFVEVLQQRLHGVDADELARLRQDFTALPLALRNRINSGLRALQRVDGDDPAADAVADAHAWLADTDLATAVDAERRSVIAQMAHVSTIESKVAALAENALASLLQGGALANVLFALGTLLNAYVFGWLIRRDPRFVHAGRAAHFYLYYGTSRLFWWMLLMVPAFGTLSYAHAAGMQTLVERINIVDTVIALASVGYLLWYVGDMARALCGADHVDRRIKLSLGWRLVASMLLSQVLFLLLFAIGMIGVLIGYHYWLAR